MERYIGIVTAVSGQRAKVRIERGLKRVKNRASLTAGIPVKRKKEPMWKWEEQTLGERQGKWIVRGIPFTDPSCGSYFGRAVSRYLPFDLGVTMFIGAIVWGFWDFSMPEPLNGMSQAAAVSNGPLQDTIRKACFRKKGVES